MQLADVAKQPMASRARTLASTVTACERWTCDIALRRHSCEPSRSERYSGTAWATYYTWSSPNAYVKVSPPATPALYRVRARAQTTTGWGAWSGYAAFDYGAYTGARPGSSTTPPPPPPTGAVPGSAWDKDR